MTEKEKLIALYAQNSKHSNYQVLSRKLSNIIDDNEIKVKTRYEFERLKYITKNMSVTDKTIIDIGGNSGFFSFELIDAGAKQVLYYEGNKVHADFVKLASKVLCIEDKINVVNQYFSFEKELKDKRHDIILLLNVLHHVGDDYDNSVISLKRAKEEMLKQLNSLVDKTSILVFQLGFNWKGNRNISLFENGTKQELIEFIKQGTRQNWEIEKIGIAARSSEKIQYDDLNEFNSRRDNSLGEFLNRPLFIMKSKKR
jgi:2-polyprenyl-3-methyl-5-hydroxy-6-metoxy-1,4-benzoquinol methylase